MKKKQNNKVLKNQKNVKKKLNISSAISKIMPYILAVLFVINLFSLVGWAGNFGKVLSGILFGCLSRFASYFVPIFMLYHSLVWYYDTKRKICVRRVTCSFVIIFLVSTLQQIIEVSSGRVEKSYVINLLYQNGKEGYGGGVIGGVIGNVLHSSFGEVLAIIIALMILSFMIIQMFNITPASIVRAIFRRDKKEKNVYVPQKSKPAVSKKHKNFDVFDDDDDDVTNDKNVAVLGADTLSYEVENNEENDDLDIRKSTYKDYGKTSFNSSRDSVYNEQIKPYNRNDDTPGVKYTEKPVGTSKQFEVDPAEQTNTFELKRKSYGSSNTVNETFTEEEEEEEEEFYPDEDFVDTDEENYADSEPKSEPINVSDYIAPEALNKITPPRKEEELQVEKRSLFGNLIKKDKEKIKDYDSEERSDEPKNAFKDAPKPKKHKKYVAPPIDYLRVGKKEEDTDAVREELQENARIIVETLNNFNTRTKIVDITRGPTVTRYELMPDAGVRVRSIANLVDDIALNLAAEGIRIECPIPGKSAVGIEVPNKITSTVYLRDLLEDNKYKTAKSKLTCAIGKSISGENIYLDIEKLPHLLVAGATGMGKSVCINSILVSLLYKASPDEVRLILIDPKRVELSNYNGIPHLLVPVVTEPKKALGTLQWAVTEMEKRFETIEAAGVRNIIEFNEKIQNGYNAEPMARVVIVIDELADLKMAVPEIEDHIMRLTQKARAAGIHLIIGTQRPSVDVITGVIKANIPSRIAFRVPSQVDSRTILDEVGAEKLVSRGDMLVKPVGALKPIRVQGAFITADEIESVINYLKDGSSDNYDEEVIQQIETNANKIAKAERSDDLGSDGENGDDFDPKFYDALDIATDIGKISSSLLQRKLGLGFQRAARIIDQMEEMGYIGEANGSKPRDVLITRQDFLELRMKYEDAE